MSRVPHVEPRKPAAGLLAPTIAALMALAVLLGLGTWQMARKSWKEALIASIEARSKSEPVSIETAVARQLRGEAIEYLPVRAEGRLNPRLAMRYYAPDPKLGPGVHLYTPLEMTSGRQVIVNEGFVPQSEWGAIDARLAGGLEPRRQVIGLARLADEKSLFTPNNDVQRNLWYSRDLHEMSGRAQQQNGLPVVPFFLEQLAAEAPIGAGFGRGGATRITLPNRHLEYALTWYGLAAALIGVYLVYARSRLVASKG